MKWLGTFLSVALGIVLGLGAFTFHFGEGFSYFSKDPAACVNCHIMNHQYESWSRSGHHHVATCNDCHMPTNGIAKIIAKARNGFNHSVKFTLENFGRPIRIRPVNQEILQANCVRCHKPLVEDAILIPSGGEENAQSCTHCHRNVGHFPIE